MLPGKSSNSGSPLQTIDDLLRPYCGSPEPAHPGVIYLQSWVIGTAHARFNRWCKRGRWLGIMSMLGADQDLEALMIDSTVVRAHQHAAGAQKKRAIKTLDAPEAG